MQRLPVRAVTEGASTLPNTRLSFKDALVTPCATCATSPCCTYLPLKTFKVSNLLELDHARYLLNFDRIELGLSAAGDWSVYYRYPCRFLDPKDFSCTVHETPRQPNICVHYNPYSCWYKRVLTNNSTDDFLRVDRRRLEFILEHVVFDDQRDIVEVPTWEALVDAFSDLPIELTARFVESPPAQDTAFDTWERQSRAGTADDTATPRLSFSSPELQSPCSGCQVYCCTTLLFPQPSPTTASNLDYFRFCLGFPGVELGIADGSWAIVVKTTCRHLQDDRCSVYGKPERPLLCKYYDALKCHYKPEFGQPRPAGFLRVRLEQFDWMTECFELDATGTIARTPPVDELRAHFEGHWRQEGVASVPRSAQ